MHCTVGYIDVGDNSHGGLFSSGNAQWLEHLAQKRLTKGTAAEGEIKCEETAAMDGVTSSSNGGALSGAVKSEGGDGGDSGSDGDGEHSSKRMKVV